MKIFKLSVVSDLYLYIFIYKDKNIIVGQAFLHFGIHMYSFEKKNRFALLCR